MCWAPPSTPVNPSTGRGVQHRGLVWPKVVAKTYGENDRPSPNIEAVVTESGGGRPRIVDWPTRMKEVAEFVGLGPAELEVVRATGPLVLKRGEELTAAVYDHFLKFPQARKFFLNDEGEVDQDRLSKRKHSLLRWLRGSVDFKIDAD